MPQVIDRGPSVGGSVGFATGNALGSGLQNLANMKLQELTQRHENARQENLYKNADYSDSQASILASLPPKERAALLEYWAPAGRSSPQKQSSLQDLRSMQDQPHLVQQQAQQLVDLFSQQQQPQQDLSRAGTEGMLAALLRQSLNPMQQPQQQIPQQQFNQLAQQQIQPQLQQQAAPMISNKPQSIYDAAQEKRNVPLLKEEIKQKRILEHAAEKETQQYYNDTLRAEKAAKEGDLRINRMDALIKKGGLPYSTFYNLFKNLEEKISPAHAGAAGAGVGAYAGGPIGAAIGGAIGGLISPVAGILRSAQKVTSPNTEEFEKLSADFVKSAKDFFPGGRITDADLKAFFAMIPTLSQTDAGKEKIIQNMKTFNDVAKARAKAMKKIIKENDGNRPRNLEILVEEKIGDQLDKLATEFISR